MFDKLKEDGQYISYMFCIGSAVGLSYLANILTTPIKNRGYQELRDEMVGNFSSSFANIFREAFDKTKLPVEKTFSVLTNMMLPMLWIIISAIILMFVIYSLGRSMLFDEDQLFDKAIKLSLVGTIGYLTYKIVQNDWYLFVLNLKMAIILGVLAFFVLALFSPLTNQRR